MNAEILVQALALPPASRVDQRVPKKLLAENGAGAAPDRRLILEGVEEVVWLASLKPTTVGVPAYSDDVRDALEIAVLRATFRAATKTPRLAELIHRAVPYPLLLIVEEPRGFGLSTAPKRRSQGDSAKVVLDDEVAAAFWPFGTSPEAEEADQAFVRALAFDRQPRRDLLAAYQGWTDAIYALQAAKISGAFRMPASREAADERRRALTECGRLIAERDRLRKAARSERQVARQVETNLRVRETEARLDAAREKL